MTIITRTNGQPFATEASARQQLAAKGLQGTHEVVSHEGGYALAPITHTGDPITLQRGDHVSTKDMTEEQYHAVARAFENAGCPRFLPKDGKGRGEILEWYDGALFSCITPEDGGRHLTIDQVLGATNAGNAAPQPEETTMTTDPIATLKQARQAHDEAEKAYQEALGEVREYLGEGFELTEVGIDAASADRLRKSLAAAMQIPERILFGDAEEDMTDPANWREGDVLIAERDKLDIREGNFYSVRADIDGDLGIVDDAGDRRYSFCGLRFHHRPA